MFPDCYKIVKNVFIFFLIGGRSAYIKYSQFLQSSDLTWNERYMQYVDMYICT